MAKLTDPQRKFIVIRIACFDSPTQVAAALKEELGVVITRQQAEEYDPTKRRPAKKWKILFDTTRAAFLADQASIGVAQKSYRLRELHDLYTRKKTEAHLNVPLLQGLLKQAAEDAGDSYTNRREVTGKGGSSLEVTVVRRIVHPTGKTDGD